MRIKSSKVRAEQRRIREAERRLAEAAANLERNGPNGVGATAAETTVVRHWDGATEARRTK